MKKHEKIARREASGFKYFTKKEQCGKYGQSARLIANLSLFAISVISYKRF